MICTQTSRCQSFPWSHRLWTAWHRSCRIEIWLRHSLPVWPSAPARGHVLPRQPTQNSEVYFSGHTATIDLTFLASLVVLNGRCLTLSLSQRYTSVLPALYQRYTNGTTKPVTVVELVGFWRVPGLTCCIILILMAEAVKGWGCSEIIIRKGFLPRAL